MPRETKEIHMKRRNWLSFMAVAVIALTTAAFAEDGASSKPMVKGNPDSKIYHVSTCRHYKAKSATKEFKTEAEAKEAGYQPCKKCAAPKKDQAKKSAADSTKKSE